MRKIFILFTFLSLYLFLTSTQNYTTKNSFNNGEYLKYRIHYGILNAGYATLKTQEVTYNSKPHYHIIGEGYTVGAVKLLFKVEDRYETYMDKTSLLSSKFIRNIREGSYKRDQTMVINHSEKKIVYTNNKNKSSKTYSFKGEVHDMLSAFYYLRSLNSDDLKNGDFINLNIFMDDEMINFKLKVLGREKIKSSFGSVQCIKIRPYVLSGRVFKEKESVTMWVTDDVNHVPIQIKAELAVGSLKADLSEYKNIQTPINFTK